jgi:RNA polymerase sigma-70 factor (ECF subfamily)
MTTIEQVMALYGRALARVAGAYEAEASLRQDLVQEMLLSIHRALPTLRDPTRLGPFVFRIAHHRGVDHVCRERRAKAVDREAEAPAPTPTAEQQALSEELSQRIEAAIRRLPLPYRQVMTLFLEDQDYAQIAEALGISITNVGVRLNRAKAQLREYLDER